MPAYLPEGLIGVYKEEDSAGEKEGVKQKFNCTKLESVDCWMSGDEFSNCSLNMKRLNRVKEGVEDNKYSV